MIILPFIPIAALILQNCWFMARVSSHQAEMQWLGKQVGRRVCVDGWLCVCSYLFVRACVYECVDIGMHAFINVSVWAGMLMHTT